MVSRTQRACGRGRCGGRKESGQARRVARAPVTCTRRDASGSPSLELHLDWPHPLSRAGSLVASQIVSGGFVDCERMWIITGPFDEDHNEQRAPDSESYPPNHD